MSNRPKHYAFSGIGSARGRGARCDKGRRLGPVTGTKPVQYRKAAAAYERARRQDAAEARKAAAPKATP